MPGPVENLCMPVQLNGHASLADPLKQLLYVSVTVLRQAIDLLDNHLTSDGQLSIHAKYLPGSTIGMLKCCIAYI